MDALLRCKSWNWILLLSNLTDIYHMNMKSENTPLRIFSLSVSTGFILCETVYACPFSAPRHPSRVIILLLLQVLVNVHYLPWAPYRKLYILLYIFCPRLDTFQHLHSQDSVPTPPFL